jgi:ACS family glucarate transporter-like MFS transporter
MTYFVRTILSIAGPTIMKEFHLSETEMGTVYSSFLFSYALLMIPGGYLTDVWGPKITLAIVALGSGALTALTGFAARPGLGLLIGVVPSLMLVRLALGVCSAPIYPACSRMNANWTPPKHRARVQGLIVAGAGVGGAASPIVFSWMISRYGWRYSFLLVGVAVVALGIIWCVYVRDEPESRSVSVKDGPPDWRSTLTDRNILLLTLGFMALDYFEYIFFYWIYYYLVEIRHVEATQSALYTTALFTTWAIMTPLGGWATDRMMAWLGGLGLRIIAVGALSLSAILLFAGAHATNVPEAVSMMALALGFAACADVTFWTATIGIAGRQSGTACGILNAGGNLGGLVAPVLTPWLASKLGWTAGLYFGSIMALLGAAVWFAINPTRKLGSKSIPAG